MASAFKTFPAVLPTKDYDYGLELAVRRRRTKSLQGEDQLRKKLIANFYGERSPSIDRVINQSLARLSESFKTSSSNEDIPSAAIDRPCPLSVISNRTISDIGTYEDWFGSEVVVPRDTDRILEQFVIMLLRIGVFKKKDTVDSVRLFSNSQAFLPQRIECPAISTEDSETPPFVGSNKGRVASYLRDYPQIFMKKPSDLFGSFSSPENRPLNNNAQNDNISSHGSQCFEPTKEISLDTVSLNQENKEIIRKNKALIHSQEEIFEYYDKDEKNIENIDNTELESTQLKIESSESIESVMNRMKIRAALNDETDEDHIESNSSSNNGNRTKSNSYDKSSTDNAQKKKDSDVT